MFIRDLLRENTHLLSCEIFPPKQNAEYESVKQTAMEIARLKPAFVSVTYGAGGGTSQNTIKIASDIQTHTSTASLAHLTCASASINMIDEYINDLKRNKLQNVLALRGDLNEDSYSHGENSFQHAFELVRYLKTKGDFCIGGACYPEKHAEAATLQEDICFLKEKVDSGCDFLITQLFFDNTYFYRFIEKIRQKNISVPVFAGIMPVTNAKQIKRICELSNASIPSSLEKLLTRYEDSKDMQKAGLDFARNQMENLKKEGHTLIHLYTMNKAYIAIELMKE